MTRKNFMAIEAALDKEGDVKWRESLSSHQSRLSGNSGIPMMRSRFSESGVGKSLSLAVRM